MRVPTPNVSAVDLTFEASKDVTVEDINEIVAKRPRVTWGTFWLMIQSPRYQSTLTTHQNPAFAPDQTKVVGGRTVRVLAWYDNEWGFSCRMADVAAQWVGCCNHINTFAKPRPLSGVFCLPIPDIPLDISET